MNACLMKRENIDAQQMTWQKLMRMDEVLLRNWSNTQVYESPMPKKLFKQSMSPSKRDENDPR